LEIATSDIKVKFGMSVSMLEVEFHVSRLDINPTVRAICILGGRLEQGSEFGLVGPYPGYVFAIPGHAYLHGLVE